MSKARQVHLRLPAGIPIALCGMIACSQPGGAQGVCVVCSEPDAVYSCQPELGSSLKPNDPRFNLLCITELARAGNHGSCSARRASAATCEGPVRTVAIGPAPALAPTAAPSAGPGALPDRPVSDPAAPPETLEQFAKQTAAQSKDQLAKTGEKIGDAAKTTTNAVGDVAKKSWDCVSSFFKKC